MLHELANIVICSFGPETLQLQFRLGRAMEASLAELLEGHSVLEAWLSGLGIASVRDVKWFWADSSECLCELESAGQISREKILHMQDLYLTCVARAELEQSTAVRSLKAARVLSVRGDRTWQPVLCEPPAKRPRVLIPWRQSGQEVTPVLREVPQSDLAPAVQKKLRELFRLAAEHFIDFKALGLSPVDWQNEQSVIAAESWIMSSARRCSKGHLSQVTSCLRRWIKMSTEMQFSMFNPSPAQLASLLQKISLGGPTAASSVFSALAWCNKNLGATFPLDHFLTRPFKCHALGHKSSQAPELQPWELVNLLAVTTELTGTAR